METTERFLNQNHLQDPEDLDALLDLAALVRTLISENRQAQLSRILQYTVEHSCLEAFSWCVGLLQEALEDPASALQSFEFVIGKSIPDYDGLMERLGVDFRAQSNGVETVCDHNGEVESFFNILVYKTGYENIRLISSENFDTKDNDYVQYKLSFVRN